MKIAVIVTAAIIGLAGLGLIASSQDTESRPLATPYYEHCFTESGAEIDCSQVEWPE